jgi:hypothetical protein
MIDRGPQQAAKMGLENPLPASWLGLPTMPPSLPATADIYRLSATEIQNLLAQIAYDKSAWDYSLIGPNNELGRYQFSTQTLERYGLLAVDSNLHYGTDSVNYTNCWRPVTIRGANSYSTYNYNITSLNGFLSSTISQEQLAYQIVYDLYNQLMANGAILESDSDDVVAGMIYVAWTVGYGIKPTATKPQGTGAYAWRYSGVGTADTQYNSGRYAITVLSR